MIRTEKRLRLCAALIAVNLCFIWGNSLLPGEISGAISDAVKNLLRWCLSFLGLSQGGGGGGGLLRKIAHFTEFACLGALFTWLFGMLQKPVALALPGGFVTAGIDETIQYFVPDRGPSFADVLIDTSGALVGMIFLYLGYIMFKKHWRTKV
jgi:VanZ family protein